MSTGVGEGEGDGEGEAGPAGEAGVEACDETATDDPGDASGVVAGAAAAVVGGAPAFEEVAVVSCLV